MAQQESLVNEASGDQLKDQTRTASDFNIAASLWDRAAHQYKIAFDRTHNPKYGIESADALFNAALCMEQLRDSLSARDRLYRARDLAVSNPDLSSRITGELQKLS